MLLMSPSIIWGQDKVQKPQTIIPKNEIGLSTGPAAYPQNANELFTPVLGAAISLSYYRNINSNQVGFTTNSGLRPDNYYYCAPSIIFNHRFMVKRSYLYAGITAGYYAARQPYEFTGKLNKENGYTFGLQAGYVMPMGKHFAFTSQIAIRSTQVWFKSAYWIPLSFGFEPDGYNVPYTATDFHITIPVTVGIRYRF